MKLFPFLCIFVLFLFLFVGCEKPEMQVAGPVAKVDIVSQSMNSSPEALPSGVTWSWRRVWVEGHHSNYGADNINGDFVSGEIQHNRSDASFESWVDSDSLTYWYEAPLDILTQGTGYLGDHCARMYGTISYPLDQLRTITEKVKIGTTIAAGDEIAASMWVKQPQSGHLNESVWLIYGTNIAGSYCGSTGPHYIMGQVSSWTQYFITPLVLSSSVNVGYICPAIQVGGDEEYTYDVDQQYDDLRIYSEASDMVPVARLSSLSLSPGNTGYRLDISGTASNFQEAEDISYFLYFEDTRDGLYYQAYEIGQGHWTSDDTEVTDDNVNCTTTLGDYIEYMGGGVTVKFLPSSDHARSELHINEVDVVTYYFE